MSYFDFGTEPQTGNFEQGTGGDFAPIPKDTQVKVITENVKWSQYGSDPEYIEIQWQITDGQYKNRKIFQKIKTQDSDPQKAKKAMMMLGAINHNATGNLHTMNGKPTDQELNNALAFKPMFLKLGVWEIETETGEKKSGNWVVAVSSKGSSQQSPAQQQNTQDVDLDSDLPF
jgi:hypothetical protein